MELIKAVEGQTIEYRVEKLIEYLEDYKTRVQVIKDKAVVENKKLL